MLYSVLHQLRLGLSCYQAVHLLSVRVDSLDRRLVQLESLERRVNEFSDVNRRLSDISHLQQRVTDLEQTLSAAGGDRAISVNSGSKSVGDMIGVANTVTDSIDAMMKQLNNLVARMTLAENQLMLQVPFTLCSKFTVWLFAGQLASCLIYSLYAIVEYINRFAVDRMVMFFFTHDL